jgi:hypothetical protein
MIVHSTIESVSRNIPELSSLAWERLIAELKPDEPVCILQGLRLETLIGATSLIQQPSDVWMARYETLRESLEKKARSQGQVQTGVFYTPVWIVRYLIQQTLGKTLSRFLECIQDALQQEQPDKAVTLFAEVQALTMIDPACGTGVFLLEALHQLYAFYQQVNRLFPKPVMENPAAYILQHQLYGVDVDLLGVMLTELRLVECAYQLDGYFASDSLLGLQSHLVCGDALAGPVFGGKFYWQLVLGNPPYISETRKQAQRFRSLQGKNKLYYQAKMDLCDAFLAWAINHLPPNGRLAYVLPEYWTQRTSTRMLREQLWQQGEICEFWQLTGNRVFKHAPGHHSSLLIWQKTGQGDTINSMQTVVMGVATSDAELTAERLQPVSFTLDATSGKLRYGNPIESALLTKLSELPPLLTKTDVQQGLVMPQGRLKKSDWCRLQLDVQQQTLSECGVFLLTDAEVSALNVTDAEQALLKPYYGPAGFQPFGGFSDEKPIYWLIYGNLENRKLIEKYSSEYSHIRAHLDRFQTVNTSAFAPYGLHRPRQLEWFEDERKILCPRQVLRPAAAVVDFPAYVNEAFYILRPRHEEPDYVCGLLNSKLAWFWFYHHKRKGVRLQIDKDVLSIFPAPNIGQYEKANVAELTRKLLKNVQSENLLSALNELIYRLYQLSEEEMRLVETAYQSIVGK